MAQTTSIISASALRAVTVRLTNTPVKELPHIASHLAAGLVDCGEALSQNVAPGKEKSETRVLVHKLKTRVSSLLQDRTEEGRWTAVVLIKAIIELGGWEMLKTSESWVRGLVSILGKPDPLTTKNLSILTLTRIFILIDQYPTLIREITTPILPSFITACLNLINTAATNGGKRDLKPNMSLLDTVLNAFQVLIPDHPTIFRPFASQIHSLLLPLIAPTTTHDSISDTTTALAQQLLVSLHHCAPKNTSGDEWTSALQATAKSVHHTADQVFRSVIEEWESSDSATRQQISKPKDFSEIVSDGGTDPLGMPAWTGIHDGIARLKGTLRLLANFVVQPTHSTVSLPVGSIIELTTRITSVTAPQGQNGLRLNPEITRDEREGLFTALPSIHVEAIAILLIILERLQGGALSIAHTILDQVLWIFETGSYNRDIRTATYTIIKALLPLLGPSLPRKSAKSLYPLIKACCDDLMTLHGVSASSTSSAPARSDSTQKPPQATSSTNADAFLGTPPSTNRPSTQSFQTPYPSLLQSASDLLPSPLTYIPPVHISPSLRAEIDRTAIILNHKEAMLASVLNPPSTKINSKTAAPSILPFLTRAFPGDPEVEALLRPRMPVLFTGRRHATNLVAREDDIEDDDVEMYDDTILAQEGQSQLPKETHTASNLHPDAQSSEEDLFGPLSAALNSPRRPSTDALLMRASLSADAESSTDAVLKRASLSADGPPWTFSGTHLDKAKAEDLPAAKKARIGSPEYEGSYAMTGAIQDMPAEPTAASEIVAAGRAVGVGETHLAGVEGVRAVAMGGTPDTSRLMGEPSDARSQDAHSQGKGIDEDDDDNSDGEIPALNIDSDTSEEEDAPT